MKSLPLLVAAGALILSGGLAGCSGQGDKQTVGTLIGAAAGAALGTQIGGGTGRYAAIAGGTLLGAWLGSEAGKSLDRADQAALENAQQEAHQAPVGETIAWNNPDSGHSGSVTPVRDGYSQSGRYCREYRTVIEVDGRQQDAYGTACRQPDGSWEIIK
ncbi:RT0821/Lpp0805 family surface protein [Roseospirillum parvum]|uniref:RT0821/Lpp0805 family surface protein n=1 Tax=Roseospirillum parvum TaxID=83401 RepID=UPI001FDF4B9D|nr:RT0821/Lpp0805 family surface protein [Roseospirillum parvum]